MAENVRQRRKNTVHKDPEGNASTTVEQKFAVTFMATIVLVLIMVLGAFFYIRPDTSHVRFIEMDRACDPATDHCIIVADLINGSRVHRAMLFANKSITEPDKLRKRIGTMVKLECPQAQGIADFHAIEMAAQVASGQCRLVHDQFAMAYVAAMGMMPFVVGALRENEQHKAKALMVGLGGGALDMFLHSKFPAKSHMLYKMARVSNRSEEDMFCGSLVRMDLIIYELDPLVEKMAHKWFGVANNPTRRTIVADGLEAFSKAAKNGEKFDVVSVDACEMFGVTRCPPASFMTDKVLRDIESIVKPTGVFVINVLTGNESEEMDFVEEHQSKLLTVFPTCIRTRFVAELANVLFCLPTRFESAQEMATARAEWDQNRKKYTQQFGLGELLSEYKLS